MEMVTVPLRVPKDMVSFLTTYGREQDFERMP